MMKVYFCFTGGSSMMIIIGTEEGIGVLLRIGVVLVLIKGLVERDRGGREDNGVASMIMGRIIDLEGVLVCWFFKGNEQEKN
jgi:hypothetical protein